MNERINRQYSGSLLSIDIRDLASLGKKGNHDAQEEFSSNKYEMSSSHFNS